MMVATALAAVALAATTPQGHLAGVTQISYGCPGPQREGEPCERWSVFAMARFRVAGRIVVSDSRGRFDVVLPAGTYRVTPLPGAHTKGGPVLTVRVVADRITRILVRFVGFPQML
jgi:hypothetical protein